MKNGYGKKSMPKKGGMKNKPMGGCRKNTAKPMGKARR